MSAVRLAAFLGKGKGNHWGGEREGRGVQAGGREEEGK